MPDLYGIYILLPLLKNMPEVSLYRLRKAVKLPVSESSGLKSFLITVKLFYLFIKLHG